MKLKNVPSDEELARQIKVIESIKDSDIDTSDIKPLTAADLKNAVFNPYFKPVKKQITVRIDGVLVEWLKSQGKGYQTRLNDILKKAMLEDMKHTH